MISFAARRGIALTLALAGVLVTLGQAAELRAAGAADPFEPIARDEQEHRLIERIGEAEARDGPFSPQLIEPFTTLFDLYRARGDHLLAAAAAERALQVVRVNAGLFSLDQIPLLRESLATEDTWGNTSRAGELERDLWALVRRNPDDPRTVPVLREFGDRKMALLTRLLAGELPAPVRIGGDFDPEFGSRSASARVMAAEAWSYYAEAIRRLRRQADYTSDEVRELEMTLVRISYVYAKDYGAGRRSLLRQAYDAARDEPLLNQVDALIRIADWDLVFSQNGTALEIYEQACALLREDGVPPEVVEAIVAPRVPVVLPSFLPNPLDTEPAGATGHIDVAFDIHKYGSTRDVTVLDATPNVSAADKDALTSVIYRSRFRPRITDGEFGHTSHVALRYYVHAQPTTDR